ncbi:MAG: tRNA(His) guanylyltransferase Thg1 family protein [Deltaproteobacteria bacterium]|nr:tRNA(His) guanylyltransferase Thg1 family protein [Deltaproteobacteria bacterium]
MDDPLGDRMKALEAVEAGRRFPRNLPILARIDGRAFSAWTRDLPRPFDPRLTDLMVATTEALVRETGACFGYTQSDEITLVLYAEEPGAQVWFDGRVAKLCSQLAAQATAVFNLLLPERLPEKAAQRSVTSVPTFDARVWTVPDAAAVVDTVRWRAEDATRNSVAMAARARFSHKACDHKDTAALRAMLREAQAPWEALPEAFKRGTMLQRRKVSRPFSTDELERLPPRHEARLNPSLVVERTTIFTAPLPRFSRVTNPEAVVLRGAEPTLDEIKLQ